MCPDPSLLVARNKKLPFGASKLRKNLTFSQWRLSIVGEGEPFGVEIYL